MTYKPGTGADAGQSDITDHKVENRALPLPGTTFTRAGYTQTGWSTTDCGEKELELGGAFAVDVSVDLYPAWEATPTVPKTGDSSPLPWAAVLLVAGGAAVVLGVLRKRTTHVG